MTPIRATPRPISRAAALAVGLAIGAGVAPTAAQTPPPTPCEAGGRYSDFDFWIGEWDVAIPDGRHAGTNHIERQERGCVLVERWIGATGGTGTSMNYYDSHAAHWKQLWVSSDGTIIEIAGGLRAGSMVLEGVLIEVSGARKPFRGTWTPSSDGSVRQHFEISENEGRTWATWFDGKYVRR